MAIDAINGYNFFMPPVDRLEGVGQGGSSRRTQGVNGGHPTAGYNPFAAISEIDCELHPDVGATGSHHVNGLGFGNHTFNSIG